MRPRLEHTNLQLASYAVELVYRIGIKRAAKATGISKNTLKAMLRRLDLYWIVKDGALNRKLMRVFGIKF